VLAFKHFHYWSHCYVRSVSACNRFAVVFDAIGRDKHALRAGEKPTPQTSAEVLALTHANVIDGISAQPLRDVTVIVRRPLRQARHHF
jgi:hypothetical protein